MPYYKHFNIIDNIKYFYFEKNLSSSPLQRLAELGVKNIPPFSIKGYPSIGLEHLTISYNFGGSCYDNNYR